MRAKSGDPYPFRLMHGKACRSIIGERPGELLCLTPRITLDSSVCPVMCPHSV